MTKAKSGITRIVLALLLLTLLLLGLIFGLLVGQKKQEEAAEKEAQQFVLIKEKAEDIERITLESKESTYSIVQDQIIQGDIILWKLENKDNTDVDQTSLKFIVQRCTDLRVGRRLGAIPEEQYAQFGFDAPLVRATVKYKSGTRSFLVGAPYANEGYYLLETGTGEVYVAQNTVAEYWGWSENKVRNLPGLSVNIGNTSAIILERRGQPEMRLVYAPILLEEGYTWQFLKPIVAKSIASKTSEYLEGLTSFAMSAYIGPSVSNPADYGFTNPFARMTFLPFDDQAAAQVIVVGDAVPDMADYRYAITYDPKSETMADCRLYALNTEGLALFRINPLNYIDRSFALVNIASVENIEFTFGEKKYEVAVKRTPKLDDDGDPIKDASGATVLVERFIVNGEQEVNEQQFRAFYAKLISLDMESILTDEDPPYSEEAVYSFALRTNIKLAEGSDATLLIEGTCYQMDDNFLALSNNGVTATKVRKSKVAELAESWGLVLEGKMPVIRDDK